MSEKTTVYYVPESSKWPIIASIFLCAMLVGAGNFIQQSTDAVNSGAMGNAMQYLFPIGFVGMVWMLFGWWKDTINESLAGINSAQMDRSYRMGMLWFIFSEVMFFAAFFGALFYTRLVAVPWLGGEGSNAMTHELLWPNFQAMWPLLETPDGRTTQAMAAWGLPFINTVILVTSSVTLTIAHHALIANERSKLIFWHAITILCGVVFLFLQYVEYHEAYTEMGLTLDAGMYGSTFFMLTGFHGMHVTIGTIFLIVMFLRVLKGHATPDNHFAFEAAAWYWHFVDVVWLFLFVTVYWL